MTIHERAVILADKLDNQSVCSIEEIERAFLNLLADDRCAFETTINGRSIRYSAPTPEELERVIRTVKGIEA